MYARWNAQTVASKFTRWTRDLVRHIVEDWLRVYVNNRPFTQQVHGMLRAVKEKEYEKEPDQQKETEKQDVHERFNENEQETVDTGQGHQGQ